MKNYFLRKMFHISLAGLILAILVSVASAQNMFRKVNDFDGDGKADFAITRDVGGTRSWYVWQTTDGFRVFQWGINSDQNAAGDYDGDGKTDFAIFRVEPTTPGSANLSFWIYGSQIGVRHFQLSSLDRPYTAHQQDFDPDGKTDRALIHYGDNIDSYLTVFPSTGGIGWATLHFGTYIKLGDMIGDSKADIASYNSSTNRVSRQDSPSGAMQTIQFGLAGDEFVPADFDGDAKGDLTIFRPSDGTWWWMRSSDNVINAAHWGQNGDTPVPADYDNDGKTDMAIYRPGSQSYYWVYGSQNGVSVFAWGITNDQPIRY
jgi:hypothetical protein